MLIAGYWIVFHLIRFNNGQRSFTVSAVTERVEITEHWKDGTSVRLPPHSSLLRTDQHFDHSILLYIPDGATIALAKKGTLPTRIQVRGSNNADLPSITNSDGERFPLQPNDTLAIGDTSTHQNESHFVMPFRGSLSLGTEVRETIEYILLRASITVIDKQPLSGRVVVLTASLDPGDDLQWDSGTSGGALQNSFPNMGFGFVSVGEDAAISVVSHINATRLTVNRYGADPYIIEPSALDSALKDRLLTDILVPIVTFAGGILLIYDIGLKVWGGWIQCDAKKRNPSRH